MTTERTRDVEAIDLSRVAELVVNEHRAAPCVCVGAAIRGARPQLIPGVALPPNGSSVWRFGWGAEGVLWTVAPSGIDTPPPQVAAHNVFDLASLTKPVTALLVARLEREGVLNRMEPLADLLPEVASSPSGSVSLDLMLSHRSGLEAHREFFIQDAAAVQPSRAVTLAAAAAARRPECPGAPPADGFPVVYSDLGYILVGAAIEQRTGRPLDELVQEQVTRPLGLTLGSIRSLERSEPVFHQRVVPTENVPWRGGVIRGVVHDENAWVLAGTGSAGHAGLFADVWSIVRLGTTILDVWSGRKDNWLRRAELEPLVRERPGGSHRSGFDGRSGDVPSSGVRFGPATFGHLGFTGTSLWLDPDRELVGVLLSNRVHPTRDHQAIKVARPRAYDAMYDMMG